MKLTPTQLEVFRLIATGRDISDYSPATRPGYIARGGNYPATIAWRAAVQLRGKGLVAREESKWVLTPEGQALWLRHTRTR